MEQRSQSPKFQKQRKFLMVLPLLVLPFITLMFWALGGGQTEEVAAQTQIHKGFNMQLPDAYLKEDKELNKMSYYNEAESDSARLKQQIKNDPYYQTGGSMPAVKNTSAFKAEYKSSSGNNIRHSPYNGGAYQDINEAKVYQKLEQLNAVLEKAENVPEPQLIEHRPSPTSPNATMNSTDLDRLEQMMQTMNQSEEADPEMQQINAMLEKVLDIQHPERVQSRIKQASQEKKGQVLSVSSGLMDDPVSLMENSLSFLGKTGSTNPSEVTYETNGFYSIDDPIRTNQVSNAIEAVVHETQTLVNGSTVKLRLLDDVYINGILIPKDNLIFGTASLNGERLQVSINSIRFQNSIFPVDLSVYDLDGMIGIYVPGAITRDVTKQSADRAVQGMNLSTYDASVGAQAASAGIEAAKTLFSKKIRLTKVTVKAGYRVFLLDEKQQQTY